MKQSKKEREMKSTTLILLSILGSLICGYFVCYFLHLAFVPESDTELQFAMAFIALGSLFGAVYFVYNLFLTCCLNKATKCISHLCSILLICAGVFFVIFSGSLWKQNQFTDEEVHLLHGIERESNCCGWKTIKIEGCAARVIDENIMSCYDVIGKRMDTILLYLFCFYVAFVVSIITTCVVVINTEKSSDGDDETKNVTVQHDYPKNLLHPENETNHEKKD